MLIYNSRKMALASVSSMLGVDRFSYKASSGKLPSVSELNQNYVSLVDIRKNWLKKINPNKDVFKKVNS